MVEPASAVARSGEARRGHRGAACRGLTRRSGWHACSGDSVTRNAGSVRVSPCGVVRTFRKVSNLRGPEHLEVRMAIAVRPGAARGSRFTRRAGGSIVPRRKGQGGWGHAEAGKTRPGGASETGGVRREHQAVSEAAGDAHGRRLLVQLSAQFQHRRLHRDDERLLVAAARAQRRRGARHPRGRQRAAQEDQVLPQELPGGRACCSAPAATISSPASLPRC